MATFKGYPISYYTAPRGTDSSLSPQLNPAMRRPAPELKVNHLLSRFGRFLCLGIFCQIFIQILINIGMNLGILPITGITLPLLSYGGSSIVSTYISLGMVNGIYSYLPKKLLVIR